MAYLQRSMQSSAHEGGRYLPRAGIHLWAPSFQAFGGGITAFSRELAFALAEQTSVRLFGKIDRVGHWHGFPLSGAGACPSRIQTAYFATSLLAAAAVGRPRLVISTHLNFGPLARLLRRQFGIPYVLVAHGIDVATGLPRSRLQALREADAVWAVSRWTRKRVLDCGVMLERLCVVHNTVSDEAFHPAPPSATLKNRYAIGPQDKVVLTVARLEAAEGYKGYDKVLRAMPTVLRALSNVRYLIVGKGSDAMRLQQLAMDLGIADRVIFCGFVADGELADHFRMADVFAMPSTGEGFGVVFLEAMACGVPVLGGNKDGTTDALADGKLGMLVDPDDVESIASGLVALLKKQGPALWFQPETLSSTCLVRYGRAMFRNRVQDALAELENRKKL